MEHFFKKFFFWFFLWLIIILAFLLRIYKISSIPPSLNWDEVSHGYNAYSILKTGKDEWGSRFPLIFRAYGDFKLPLYIYLTAIIEAFLGLSALAVRLVSILSGVGLVLVAYLTTLRLTKEKSISFLAAFLTAVSPWSLFLSRVAVEANLGAFLFSAGFYFLICWLDKNDEKDKGTKIKDLILTALFWGLSLHSYNSARILVPLSIVFVFFLGMKKKRAGDLIAPFLILLIFFLPMFFQFFDRSAKARFSWVSLIDEGAIATIIEKRTGSSLPGPLPTLIFNKVTYFAYTATRNYYSNFSIKYLFFRGGSHYQFSLPDHELLYLVTAPFLLLGFWRVLRGNTAQRTLLVWFLAAFIPSAITRDSPHVLRSIFVLPTPMILSGLGIDWVTKIFKKGSILKGRLLILTVVFSVSVSFIRWWRDYSNLYPKAYSWSWQYGYKDAISFIKENYSKYERIFFTKRYGEPHEFILFYWPWEPASYQNDSKIWDFHANWYWVDKFAKFEFINDWEIKDKLKVKSGKSKVLLITSPENYPDGWSKIKTINFLDGKQAFEILEK